MFIPVFVLFASKLTIKKQFLMIKKYIAIITPLLPQKIIITMIFKEKNNLKKGRRMLFVSLDVISDLRLFFAYCFLCSICYLQIFENKSTINIVPKIFPLQCVKFA